VARACLKREPWLVPLDRPVAEVMALAKRDLQPGEALDEFGGYTCYGVIDRAEVATAEHALPMGLAPGARVVRPVAAGAPIRREDVSLDESSLLVRLRRRHDALIAETPGTQSRYENPSASQR